MPGTALVLGITGGFGHAAARALDRHGWRLRAMHRDPDRARGAVTQPETLEWRRGDAMRREDVAAAARGADVIVHAVNPPGYRNWRGLAPPMLAHSIDAAGQAGARLVFPGNVYNYGPDAWPLVAETAPQHPRARKGAIRVELERMLAGAARAGARVLIIRAGDFFGGPGRGSWFDAVMVKPGREVRSITYPGAHDAGHAWAYLPDLAEAVARLADRDGELAPLESFHFGGHYLDPGIEMAEAIRRVTARRDLPVRGLPWIALRLAAPFNETYRELLEMRYLWDISLRLDNRKLVGLLGEEPHTPLDEAVRQSLVELGCLPAPAQARRA
ncbi:MAG TPA: NAD-dependent epimerase/dehydratase family protein [Gammaproteobacteria bacterium]|nr:NAD-dependent epimerase/dehydratase family protein [Gammaproteobacteria bacterium]